MTQHPEEQSQRYADRDRTWLERELATAHTTTRDLLRRLEKAQQQLAETTRAYNKTVENMTEIVRENLVLNNECERLKLMIHRSEDFAVPMGGLPVITPEEARAIRKAMARLHHPDVGGNHDRMKSWNALLDKIEEGRPR